MPREKNGEWLGALIFGEEKLEEVVASIVALVLQPRMAIFFYFGTTRPLDYASSVIVFPFYAGGEDEGRRAFSEIFATGPVADQTE